MILFWQHIRPLVMDVVSNTTLSLSISLALSRERSTRVWALYPGSVVVWRMCELGTQWYPTPKGILPNCRGCLEAV